MGGRGCDVNQALDTAWKRIWAVLTSSSVSVSQPTGRHSKKHLGEKFDRSYFTPTGNHNRLTNKVHIYIHFTLTVQSEENLIQRVRVASVSESTAFAHHVLNGG